MYTLVEGTVQSQHDGQLHFVSYRKLQRLYGLEPSQCTRRFDHRWKCLWPREDGVYDASSPAQKRHTTWKTQGGSVLKIADMAISHLLNTLAFLERRHSADMWRGHYETMVAYLAEHLVQHRTDDVRTMAQATLDGRCKQLMLYDPLYEAGLEWPTLLTETAPVGLVRALA
jgi:hypothetical protein